MNFFHHIKDARQTVLANKMRSWLSSLGIIIGISSVVLILSAWHATQSQFMNNLWSMSSNSVSITTRNKDANESAVQASLNDDMVKFLVDNFSFLSGNIALVKSSPGIGIKYNADADKALVQGISEGYLSLTKEEFLYGQDFTTQDFESGAPVAIINYNSLRDFFDTDNPLGRELTINGTSFRVIGILKQSTSERMGLLDGVSVYIPAPAYAQSIRVGQDYDSIDLYLPEEYDNEQRRQIIYYSLLQHLGVSKVQQAHLSVDSFASFADQIQSAMSVFSIFLAIIGGISLLVGGIGVMNIMIVSVTERTREIGIRKAIGALKKDIIMQFLTESIVLTSLGGIIAVMISYVIILIANTVLSSISLVDSPFEGFHISIPLGVLVLAFSLTSLVGVGFGILPARKAAALKPIDALRFE